MSRVAVLCPTRDRPGGLARLIRSVMETSAVADVLSYVDADQVDDYSMPGHGFGCRWLGWHGERVGPVASANLLVDKFPSYDVYGLVTDDSVLTVPGWDEWLLEVVKQFPKRLAIVSPHHNMGNHVDMPFVTKEWIREVGWYACPEMKHYCWPTIASLIGEMTGICHSPEQRFHVEHDDHIQNHAKQIEDAQPFYEFVSLKLPAIVEKLRQAMV